MSDNPKSTVTRLLGVAALAACATLAVVTPAIASTPAPAVAPTSQGSVPSEIARYAADPDGLLARLDDLFGVTTSGQGIDFDETTEVGQLNRAWVFTEAWQGGGASDDPVELTNLWTAPIVIAEKPVGLATIWVNPATDAPDLADFDRSASVAAALMDVPAEAHLVRDEPRSAWFTLVEGQLTPLVTGDSGVNAPTAVTAYQRTFTGAEPPPEPTVQLDGLLGASIVAGAAVVVVLAVLLLPMLRRRAGDDDPDDGLTVSTGTITLPTRAERRVARSAEKAAEKAAAAKDAAGAQHAPVVEQAAASEPAATLSVAPETDPVAADTAEPVVPEPATPPAPAAPKAARTKSSAPKAAAGQSATSKPAGAKTAAAKSAAPKPATTKPATTKSATTNAATRKPSTAKPSTAKPKKPATPPEEPTP